MNIFEQATRAKLRFQSVKGELSTEQLWDLPLTSKTGFDLDTLAKETNKALKEQAEESFVESTNNPLKTILELKLEVLKHIIGVRLTENQQRQQLAERQAEKERLKEILAKKQDAALENLSEEEIKKRLAELG